MRPRQTRWNLNHMRALGVLVERPEDAVALGWGTPYTPAAVGAYPAGADLGGREALGLHVDRVAAMVASEGPIAEAEAVRRLALALRRHRDVDDPAATAARAVRHAVRGRRVRARDGFLRPAGAASPLVRVPVSCSSASVRPSRLVPVEELDLAVLRVAEAACPIDRLALGAAVAGVFGWPTSSPRLDGELGDRISAMLADGRLEVAGRPRGQLPADFVALGRRARLPDLGAGLPNVGSWVRHPHFGAGRVLGSTDDTVTLELGDDPDGGEVHTFVLGPGMVRVPGPRPVVVSRAGRAPRRREATPAERAAHRAAHAVVHAVIGGLAGAAPDEWEAWQADRAAAGRCGPSALFPMREVAGADALERHAVQALAGLVAESMLARRTRPVWDLGDVDAAGWFWDIRLIGEHLALLVALTPQASRIGGERAAAKAMTAIYRERIEPRAFDLVERHWAAVLDVADRVEGDPAIGAAGVEAAVGAALARGVGPVGGSEWDAATASRLRLPPRRLLAFPDLARPSARLRPSPAGHWGAWVPGIALEPAYLGPGMRVRDDLLGEGVIVRAVPMDKGERALVIRYDSGRVEVTTGRPGLSFGRRPGSGPSGGATSADADRQH